MSDVLELAAEVREDVGKGASRRLRRIGNRVPGIIYGDNKGAVSLTVNDNELGKVMKQEAFYSQVLSIKLSGSTQQAVVRDLQRHPATNKVMHIDFFRVSANKPIEVHVPIHFINEDTCVGVKQNGGTISHNLIEVEVSSLPADIPEYFEVDMAALDIGDSIHLSDLVVADGVTIVALTHGEDHDIPVVSVQERRVVEEPIEEEVEAGDEAAASEEAGEDDDDDEDRDD